MEPIRRWFGRLCGSSPKPLFMESLVDKHFVITGGSSGIGLALAKYVITAGAFVTIIGRNERKLQRAMASIQEVYDAHLQLLAAPQLGQGEIQPRSRVLTKAVDVTDYAGMIAALTGVEIDVLVCGAKVKSAGFLGDITEKDAYDAVSTNVLGVMYTVRAALPGMKARSQNHPSSIVLIGCFTSMFRMYGHGVYTATKYAVQGIAECLRLELSPYQIRVNLVCPGIVLPLFEEAELGPEASRLQIAEISSYGVLSPDTPENVATVIAKGIRQGTFLVTNEATAHASFIVDRGFMPPESMFQKVLEKICFLPLRRYAISRAKKVKEEIVRQHRRLHASQN